MRKGLRASIFVATALFASVGLPNPALANTVYSGTQNLVLQGTASATQSLTIAIAGDAVGSWDQLKLSVFPEGPDGSGGAYDAVLGSWVTLAAFPGADPSNPLYPYVQNLEFGDPIPTTGFNWSGSPLFWLYDTGRVSPPGIIDAGEFKDGTGYAAMVLVGGYYGWIHLSVSGYQSATPTLTVIDWAYSNVAGESLSIGQGDPTPAPEPGGGGVLTVSILGLLVISRNWLRYHLDRTSTIS